MTKLEELFNLLKDRLELVLNSHNESAIYFLSIVEEIEFYVKDNYILKDNSK